MSEQTTIHCHGIGCGKPTTNASKMCDRCMAEGVPSIDNVNLAAIVVPRTQVQVGDLKLWRIIDREGERHLYAASSEQAAIDFHVGIDYEFDAEEDEIVPVCEDVEITYIDEEGQPKVKASVLMADLDGQPAQLATSDY